MENITNDAISNEDIVIEDSSLDTSVENASTPEKETLRDTISKAFDNLAEKEKTANEETSAEEKPKAKATSKSVLPVTDATKPEISQAPTEGKEIDPVTGRELEPIKAPAGWTPALREKWSGIPRDVQQFIQNREKDMSSNFQQFAEARKLRDQWKDIAEPYSDFHKQFKTDALTHAKGLFELSYSLNTGSPQTKAKLIYDMINHFKPDPQTLQALFSGQQVNVPTPPPPQRQPSVDEIVDKRLEERSQVERDRLAQEGIDAFANNPANEFFYDVQQQMGKAIDGGFVTGKDQAELLQNAYNFACAQHPEVQQIISGRSSQAAIQAPVAVQKQAKAVPSVKPSLGSSRSSAAPKRYTTTRDAALAAWDKLSSEK